MQGESFVGLMQQGLTREQQASFLRLVNPPDRYVQRFRGGLVFKARRLCVSLNSRLESNT